MTLVQPVGSLYGLGYALGETRLISLSFAIMDVKAGVSCGLLAAASSLCSGRPGPESALWDF